MMEPISGHEILIGTYEEYVLGFYPASDGTPTLTPSFTDHAHCGPVRSITAGGKFLLSGGTNDENAKIFNLRNRSEHGQLYHHDGAINVMVFYDDKNIITAAEDNKICIIRANSWTVEKTLLKHEAGVNDVSIHPSGKLALSVAKDNKLITWNLVKGRSAYVTNLHQIADVVQWSPEGTRYAVGMHKRVDVYDVATAAISCSMEVKGRTNAIVFLDEDTIVVAADMPELVIFNSKDKKEVRRFTAHERRVRCLKLIREDNAVFLVSASNDGHIKVWRSDDDDITDADDVEFEEVGAHNTKCRITCMSVHKVPDVKAEPLSKKELKRRAAEALKELKEVNGEAADAKKKPKKRVSMMVAPEEVKVESDEEATSKKPKLVVEIEDGSQKGKRGKKRKKRASM